MPCEACRQALEDVLGEEAGILREEREQDAIEEVGDLLRVVTSGTEALGELGEVAGGLLGDLGGLDARSELLGRGEDGPERRERFRWVVGGQVVEGDGVELRAEVGEVGPDLDRVEVGDDEERRVAQVLAVAEQLDVGGLQVLALALVLPAEEVLLPDVGEAVSPTRLGDGLLEGVVVAGRVGLVGRRLAEHPAQVDEVFLGGGLLLRLVVAPLLGELARCQGRLGHAPLP